MHSNFKLVSKEREREPHFLANRLPIVIQYAFFLGFMLLILILFVEFKDKDIAYTVFYSIYYL